MNRERSANGEHTLPRIVAPMNREDEWPIQNLGLTKTQVGNLRHALQLMLQSGALSLEVAGHIEAVVRTQEEQGWVMNDKKQRSAENERRAQNRKVFLSAFAVIGGSAILGVLGKLGMLAFDWLDKESVNMEKEHQRQQEETLERIGAQKGQIERQVLGTTPSTLSTNGWRIRDPQATDPVVFKDPLAESTIGRGSPIQKEPRTFKKQASLTF
ncbi:MAG: hypothetical protein Q8R11_03830, partial [bacterium]|nr:hypothetical protein [bacterium]